MSNKIQPFHLAVPVKDLSSTRNFYGKLLGMEEGRSCDHWIDWNFFGHQFVTHLNQEKSQKIINQVDGHGVPVPHFGVVLEWEAWHQFAEKLKNNSHVPLIRNFILRKRTDRS